MSAGPFPRAASVGRLEAESGPDEGALTRELARARVELGRREAEVEQLLATLRTHNQSEPGESSEQVRDLQARMERSETEALSLADELARERRRSASAKLHARLSDAEVRRYESELRDAEASVGDAHRQTAALGEGLELARREGADFEARSGAETRALTTERDAALARAEEALLLRRIDEFAAWFLQTRVALGLLRRTGRGARSALLRSAEAKDILSRCSPEAVSGLGGRRTVVLLQARALLSGTDRAREAVRFRIMGPQAGRETPPC